MKENNLGLVHLYHGDGKGKTTACMGLAVRAVGSGYNVLVSQFLKSGSSSEIKTLTAISGIEFIYGKPTDKFTFQMSEEELKECRNQNSIYLKKIINKTQEQKINILIMDEVINAVSTNTLNESELIDLLKNKPTNLEIIMSGRNPSDSIKELCDYISEIKKEKHPFDNGITARKGIEM